MEWIRGGAVGRGSFATVNLAIPRSCSDQIPPLMVVKSSPLLNSASLEHEKEVLSELSNCPHVIQCFGDNRTYENNTSLYNLFLEYASGGSLSDRVKNSKFRLPECDVRRYTRSILEGLDHIHNSGFVHCDIKLQNILLCENGVVKIADFGLAKRAREEGGFGFRGTPLYMSPESVTGGEYESPADIWALGCAVVEMVTGKPAWSCSPECDVTGLLFRIGVGEELPEIPGALSEEGKDFLGKCFVRDPRRRWTAQMLLEHPFVCVDDDAIDVKSDDTVTLDKQYSKPSTSPKSPFDFPEWSVLGSPGSDTWMDGNLGSCFGSTFLGGQSSSAERIRRLVSDQRPDWSVTDSWVTVR